MPTKHLFLADVISAVFHDEPSDLLGDPTFNAE